MVFFKRSRGPVIRVELGRYSETFDEMLGRACVLREGGDCICGSRLVFAGRRLDVEKPLSSESGIEPGSTLHVLDSVNKLLNVVLKVGSADIQFASWNPDTHPDLQAFLYSHFGIDVKGRTVVCNGIVAKIDSLTSDTLAHLCVSCLCLNVPDTADQPCPITNFSIAVQHHNAVYYIPVYPNYNIQDVFLYLKKTVLHFEGRQLTHLPSMRRYTQVLKPMDRLCDCGIGEGAVLSWNSDESMPCYSRSFLNCFDNPSPALLVTNDQRLCRLLMWSNIPFRSLRIRYGGGCLWGFSKHKSAALYQGILQGNCVDWKPQASMHMARWRPAIVIIAGVIVYAIGGDETLSCEKYHRRQDVWLWSPSLPAQLANVCWSTLISQRLIYVWNNSRCCVGRLDVLEEERGWQCFSLKQPELNLHIHTPSRLFVAEDPHFTFALPLHPLLVVTQSVLSMVNPTEERYNRSQGAAALQSVSMYSGVASLLVQTR